MVALRGTSVLGSQLLQNIHSFFRRLAARSAMRDFVFARLFSVWLLSCGYFVISKTICREIKQFPESRYLISNL